MRCLGALALCLSFAASAQDVYRWVDADGETHYTNDPKSIPKDAKPEATGGTELNAIAVQGPVELEPPFEIHPDADVSDIDDAYSWARPRDYVKYVLGKRFPAGWAVIEKSGEACIDQRVTDRDVPAQLAAQIPFLVRDCGRSAGGLALVGKCPAHPWPARSVLAADAFAEQRPACAPGQTPIGCDAFTEMLAGANGQGGLDTLLADWAQAIYALTADHVTSTLRVSKPASRTKDQLLTLTWYVERYLRYLREQRSADYEVLKNDCWRHVLLDLTLASQWALMQTQADPWLALDEWGITERIEDPALADELLRATMGAATSSR